MAETDEAAWQRLLAGDPDAFGVLWDRHRDRVFAHLIRRGFARSDAEDLTATVFLECWRRRGAVRFVDGSALPWLVVTAQNVAKNASRARRRYQDFLSRLPADVPTADPAETIAEISPQLRQVLAGARRADGQLLALTVLEGFTIREAAATLGITEPAAKMRLSRLKARIRAECAAPQQFGKPEELA